METSAPEQGDFRGRRRTAHGTPAPIPLRDRPFRMIPLSTDRPTRRTPLVNGTLIGLNVAIALAVVASGPVQQWTAEHCYLDPLRPRVWQFITYQFLHDPTGVLHLAFNMLFLWVFGNAIEDKLGHFAYACFYLGGGVAAGLAHAATSAAPVLGASGSVSAVTGLFLALFPLTRIRVIWILILVSIIEIPSAWFIGFALARDIWGALSGAGGVAYFAHLAGNGFGFLVGMTLLWTRLVPRDPYDLLSLVNQWNRRRQFRSITDRGYDPWAGRRGGSGRKDAFKEERPRGRGAAQAEGAPIDEEAESRLAVRQRVADLIAKPDLPAAAREYARAVERWPEFVLGEAAQLDLATHLFAQQEYARALAAFASLMSHYPTADANGRVRLLMGVALARYLNRPGEARPLLNEAIDRLGPGADRDLAREILDGIAPDSK